MLRRACSLHILHRPGPGPRRGYLRLPFHMLAIFHRRRQDMPPNSLVGQAVSQGTSKEGRKPRDPRNSHLKRNLFISSWALLFHHGYQSPFFGVLKKTTDSPPLSRRRCDVGLVIAHLDLVFRFPATPQAITNTSTAYHIQYSSCSIPPGSQVVSTCHHHF